MLKLLFQKGVHYGSQNTKYYTFADRGEEDREDTNLLTLPKDVAKLTKQSDIGRKV